jgi:HlyD family secretion protein
MVKRIIIGILLALAVVGITVAGVIPRPPAPVEVQLAMAVRQTITRTITAAGKLESATTVKINSNVSGDVIELNVKVGDRVTRGQILARVDPTRNRALSRSAQAALSAIEADAAVARVQVERDRAELARITGLNAKGMASSAEVDQLKSQVAGDESRLVAASRRADQARAQLEEASDYLAKCTLVSPIDGEVIQLDRELGERVRGSDLSEDVVMVLATLAQMEVKVEVGEHEVVYLHLGDKALVQLDAIEDVEFHGRLMEIGQNAIVRNRGTEAEVTSFPVRVGLDARPPGALPGMSATVRVETETHDNAVVLPIQAVTVRPEKTLVKKTEGVVVAAVDKKPGEGKPAPATATDARGPEPKAESGRNELKKVVFVVKEGKAELRQVKTGLSSETSIEIVDGVADGEQVISGPYRTIAKELADGDPVTEKKSKVGELQDDGKR